MTPPDSFAVRCFPTFTVTRESTPHKGKGCAPTSGFESRVELLSQMTPPDSFAVRCCPTFTVTRESTPHKGKGCAPKSGFESRVELRRTQLGSFAMHFCRAFMATLKPRPYKDLPRKASLRLPCIDAVVTERVPVGTAAGNTLFPQGGAPSSWSESRVELLSR